MANLLGPQFAHSLVEADSYVNKEITGTVTASVQCQAMKCKGKKLWRFSLAGVPGGAGEEVVRKASKGKAASAKCSLCSPGRSLGDGVSVCGKTLLSRGNSTRKGSVAWML